MKNTVFFLALLALVNFSIAQSDPTLSVGLSSLTSYSKGTIDVELLTEIILEKQQELKDEALKRFMFRLFPEENYTTKFYLQSALHILLNEKNPEVIRKELMEILTNYSLALGFSLAYKKLHPSDLSDYKGVFVDKAVAKREALLTTYKNYQKVGRLNRLNHQIKQLQLELDSSKSDAVYEYIGFRETLLNEFYDSALKEFEKFVKDTCLQINADDKRKELCDLLTDKFDEFQKGVNPDETERVSEIFDLLKINPGEFQSKGITNKSFRKTKRKGIRLARKEKSYRTKKFRKGFQENHFENTENESIPFHLLLDVVATVLSENDTLQKKGFYKNKVDYQKSYAYANFNQDQKNSLKILADKVKNSIEIYIDQYQWFKELSKELRGYNESGRTVFEAIKDKYKDELKTLLTKNNSDLLKNLAADNSDYYEDYLRLNDSLKSFQEEFNKAQSALANLAEKNKDTIKKDLDSLIEKAKGNDEISTNDKEEINKNILRYTSEKTLVRLNNIFSNLNLNEEPKTSELTLNKMQVKRILSENESPVQLKPADSANRILPNLQIIEEDEEYFNNANDINVEKLKESIEKFSLRIDRETDSIVTSLINQKYDSNLINGLSEDIFTIQFDHEKEDSLVIRKAASFAKRLYLFVENLKKKGEKTPVKDILFVQDSLLPEFVELRVLLKNDDSLESVQNRLEAFLPYLKSKALNLINNTDKLENLDKDQINDITELLSFLANLDNLNKAETFESILDLFRKGNEEVQKHLKDNDFGRMYTLFANTIKKYTLINSEEQKINVDVASALIELEAYYDKNKIDKWGFYLGIGISQNWIPGSLSFPDATNNSSTIALASEKLGVQLKIMDFRRADDYKNTVPGDVYLSKQSPFINEWYTMAYGSGLLYSVANATSNQAFDYPQIGVGTGIRFYNALDFNLTLSMPFIEDQSPFSNLMIGVGFDIPLSEYLSRSRAKRAKKDE
ncbi:MAG: hypothetical protein AAGB24_02380 [Bacteroidota bacterium]